MYKLHRETHSRSKIEDGLIYRGLTVNFKVQILNKNNWGYIVIFFLLICLKICFECFSHTFSNVLSLKK